MSSGAGLPLQVPLTVYTAQDPRIIDFSVDAEQLCVDKYRAVPFLTTLKMGEARDLTGWGATKALLPVSKIRLSHLMSTTSTKSFYLKVSHCT